MERRTSRVSEAQWNILIEFLENNPSLARSRGYNNSARGRAEASRLWQEAATLLNSERSGTLKSPKGWSIYVSNYKSKLKKIVADINTDATATGGGPPQASNLTDFETRFLALLGEGFGQTAPQVMVLPFPNQQPSTSATNTSADDSLIVLDIEHSDIYTQSPEEVFQGTMEEQQPNEEHVQITPEQIPASSDPLLPRQSRQSTQSRRRRQQRTRPLAPLDEARRILSQVEMARAAADVANSRAQQEVARNLAPIAEIASSLGRLADAAQQYVDYLVSRHSSHSAQTNK